MSLTVLHCAENSNVHTHITLQPLRIDVRPGCIRRLGSLAALTDPPDTLYNRRWRARQQLDSAEGRLRAQVECPLEEAFPPGVGLQVRPLRCLSHR